MKIERLFTKGLTDPYESCGLTARTIETTTHAQYTATAPKAWGIEAVTQFSETAFNTAIPAQLQLIEENTLPSWLWQRRPIGKSTEQETSVTQVFDRIAGAATYKAWKVGLLMEETPAHNFYDELRFMMVNRYLSLGPQKLAGLGINWAYGISFPKSDTTIQEPSHKNFNLENVTIDAILNGSSLPARTQLQKNIHESKSHNLITFAFSDTAAEWGQMSSAVSAPQLMLDLLRFYHADSGINVPALQQAVRLGTICLEMLFEQLTDSAHNARPLAIGYCNLAGLLMALAIPYDSDAGRATAAAISAIITAEATATSAELAALLGPCAEYKNQREIKLRTLRNQRRVAYGEQNDYEHISILPTPLTISAGVNLILVAAARRRWDEALDLVQQHGLRHLQLTALFATPAFLRLLECTTQGAAPEFSLVQQRYDETGNYFRTLHSGVTLGLTKSKLDPADARAIADYITGYNTLVAAPAINHQSLIQRGFDTKTLQKLDSHLSQVMNIRQAFTPWILGEEFCHQKLKMSKKDILDPSFDILIRLGFTVDEIESANAFCCGHRTIIGATELSGEYATIFASQSEMSLHAQIRMAAAVQSFITGDADLVLSLPENTDMEARTQIIFSAWRQGIKSITLFIEYDRQTDQKSAQPAVSSRKKLLGRHPTMFLPKQTQKHQKISPVLASPRVRKLKASSRSVAIKRGKAKPTSEKRR